MDPKVSAVENLFMTVYNLMQLTYPEISHTYLLKLHLHWKSMHVSIESKKSYDKMETKKRGTRESGSTRERGITSATMRAAILHFSMILMSKIK